MARARHGREDNKWRTRGSKLSSTYNSDGLYSLCGPVPSKIFSDDDDRSISRLCRNFRELDWFLCAYPIGINLAGIPLTPRTSQHDPSLTLGMLSTETLENRTFFSHLFPNRSHIAALGYNWRPTCISGKYCVFVNQGTAKYPKSQFEKSKLVDVVVIHL